MYKQHSLRVRGHIDVMVEVCHKAGCHHRFGILKSKERIYGTCFNNITRIFLSCDFSKYAISGDEVLAKYLGRSVDRVVKA